MDTINLYYLVKSIHIISIIAWMAAMLYLPRLFVYHADKPRDSESDVLLKTMEEKLCKIIMTPAMISSFVFGTWLIFITDATGKWLHLKLLFVFLLAGYHGVMIFTMKKFKYGRNQHSPKFYRIINEIPTVLMIIIVFVVVYK